MTTVTSTTRYFIEEHIVPGTFAIVDNTTGHYVRNTDDRTRVFSTRASARKALTRLRRQSN